MNKGDNHIENIDVYQWERIDDLQYNGLKIIQDTRSFCFGVDAVLLANFANVRPDDHVMDLCTGTGIIPILIAGKTDAARIDAMEIQSDMAAMANRSVAINRLEDKVSVTEGDLKEALNYFGASSFDVVTCNPPYMNQGGGLINPNDSRAISRHEIKCTLEDVIAVSARLLKTGGKFNMVHRPERLIDIVWLMRTYKLEPKRLRFVHPSPGKKPNMLLIEGVRSGRPQLKMMDPLYVYNGSGEYSDEINRIYCRQLEATDK